MPQKRNIEVFSAGCPVCDAAVQRIKALACSSCDVTVLDIDGEISLDDPYLDLKTAFAAAKEALELSGGETAVAEAYHSSLVSPFCLTAVMEYFGDR